MRYRRSRTNGGTYFFTVNLAHRQSDLLVTHVDALRFAVRSPRQGHPFEILPMVREMKKMNRSGRKFRASLRSANLRVLFVVADKRVAGTAHEPAAAPC